MANVFHWLTWLVGGGYCGHSPGLFEDPVTITFPLHSIHALAAVAVLCGDNARLAYAGVQPVLCSRWVERTED
jgi:hypothetical protein